MIATVRTSFQAINWRSQIFKSGVGSIVVNVANTIFGIAVSVVLARMLGAEGFGIYSYIYTIVSFLLIITQFGLPTLLVRETARAEVHKAWPTMRGIWIWADCWGIVSTAILMSAAILLSWFILDRIEKIWWLTLGSGLIVVLLRTLIIFRASALRGLRRIVQAQMLDNTLRHMLFIGALFVFYWVASSRVRPDQAMALHAASVLICLLTATWALRVAKPAELSQHAHPVYESRRWLGSAIPLVLVASMEVINTQVDMLMLGIFDSASHVGIYRVASQGAGLVAFGLTALGMMAMPYMARFHAQQQKEKMQDLAKLVARAGFFLALPAALIYVAFGEQILSLVFGSDFAEGYRVLVILSLSKIISPIFGMTGSILSMSGYERDAAKGLFVAVVSNVIMNLILIPLYGMDGAAIATGITILIWSIVLWYMVRKRVGIDGSIFLMKPSTHQFV